MFGVLKIGKLGASMKRAGFNPRTLFSASEPGAWYDPSDMSTLFQDSAGTTPVTAVEQPVGRMLDLSGRGNHATQATTTKRPIYSRRVNLFSDTEGQVVGDSTKYTCERVAGNSPPGTEGYIKLTATGVAAVPSKPFVAPSTSVAVSFYIKKGSRSLQTAMLRNATTATNFTTSTINVDTGAVTGPWSCSDAGNGWWQLSLVHTTGISPGDALAVYLGDTGTNAAGTYWLLAGITATSPIDAHLPYQRVNTATDYDADPAKFPAYRRLDGVDDSRASATGGGGTAGFFLSQAITVLGGAGTARTLFSDAGTNTGYIVRLNTSNQLELAAGNGVAYTTIATAGTLAVNTTDVVQAWDDGTSLNVKIGNGATASIARPVVSAGTAGYTMGQDNGASTGYFNGRIYSDMYRKDSGLTQVQREAVALYQRQKARMP